ncbi:hypothetical protein FACS189450_09830 [Spirochaetia bacterium]|nr:hypothetical protein FACS189450_09830 [Spirochaetia bacterium]
MKENKVLAGIIGALLLFGLGSPLYAQTDMEYNVAVDGVSYGPYDSATLKEMVKSGTLTENTYVWKVDMPDWVRAETVPEIAALIASVLRGYKVAVDGVSYGPYNLAILKDIAQKGTLTGSTYVWKAGMPDWVRAETVPEIAAFITSVPPAPSYLNPGSPYPDAGQVLETSAPKIRDFHQVGEATGQLGSPGLSIAHPSLPLGIQVRVTNPQNGQTVIAAVTDRIPVSADRIADLSGAVASGIGMEGSDSIPVILEIIDDRRVVSSPYPAQAAAAPWVGHDNPFGSIGISDEYLRRLIKTSSGSVSILMGKLKEALHAAELDDSILREISYYEIEDLIKRYP